MVERLFYTVVEAAHALGIDKDIVRDHVKCGEWPAKFESGKYKIPRAWVAEHFMEECFADALTRQPDEE